MTASSDQTHTFLLEEYRALRKEVELYLTESRSQERYTLIAVGAIWAWLITYQIQNRLPWAIPIVLTAATSLRMWGISLHLGFVGKRLRQLECAFGVKGWEQMPSQTKWGLGVAFIILDFVLLALTIVGFCAHDTLGALTLHK